MSKYKASCKQVVRSYYVYILLVLATYERLLALSSKTNYADRLYLEEHHRYGNARIGTEYNHTLIVARAFTGTDAVPENTCSDR